MKKIISSLLIFAVIFAAVPAVFAEDASQTEEAIEYQVNLINERIYYKNKIDCYPLDISSVCNRGYKDEVAGDGVGGWSDQGPKNDLSSFTLRGTNYLCNIPFNFIAPENNNGKSCIMLRGQKDESCPLSAEIPVNDTAEGMYVLHGAAWGSNGKKVGKYGFVYDDGTSAMFEIECGTHIADYWGTKSNGYMRTGWTGSNESSSVISLNIFALNNPHPEKKIKCVKLLAYGDYTYMGIVAVTMVRSGLSFPIDAAASSSSLKPSDASMWATAKYASESEFAGTILDSSKYLDAPAGKHGLLKADGESLVFEDGTKAKLWGTNITGNACYPEKEEAEELAGRIARCGYSLVRFSDMDCSELTEERLGKLAYFQSLLKEKGIYTYFSLLGAAKGDEYDISDGWKLEGLFDDTLIEKQQQFAKKLLTYENKYTGTSFAEDPSVVMIDLADRNTMYDYKLGDSSFTLMSDESKKILTEKFNAYLKDKYKTTSLLKKSWKVVYDDEKIEDGTVAINGNWKYGLYYDDAHRRDVYEFFGKIQQEYYEKLSGTIRNTGYRGLISGVTNTWNNYTPYNSYSQSRYADFVAVNAVNANGYESTAIKDGMCYIDYSSILTGDSNDGMDLLELAENRVKGVPYIVSEWGTGVLSPTFSEKPILMSVLAAQQSWTPVQYCFVYDKISTDKYEDLYSTYQNPVLLSLAHLTAALYYNTDELEDKTTVNYNTDYLYKDKNQLNGVTPNTYRKFETPQFNSFFTKRSGVTFTGKKTDERTLNDKTLKTKNGGFYLDFADGIFITSNDKAVAIAGDISKPKKHGRISLDVYGSYAYAGLISADDKNIDESERMIFVIGSRTLNTNTNMTVNRITDAGEAPIIYYPIPADVTIKNAAGYDVYALDNAGHRLKKLYTEQNDDGSVTFTVNSGVQSLNYEIVKGE